MKFDELTTNQVFLEKIKELNFTEATEIQEKCIPLIYEGKDVVGQAETGSGKTLAFGIPILDRIVPEEKRVQALILTPTRELCVQVADVLRDFGYPLSVKTISVYGGVGIEPQIHNMKTAHIVVGTPGRILDHLRRKTLDVRNINFLVLDEADKMFDMGFIDDVETIIHATSKKRQTLMFSATISEDVHRVIRRHLSNPVIIKTQNYVDAKKLHQVYYDIYDKNDKFSLLLHLLKTTEAGLSIIFCSTRVEASILEWNLKNNGINALGIHGGMTQKNRQESLDALRQQKIDVLVATDVASRGLDIQNVTHVYNYDVPATPKEYIHRVGRTARAGKNGVAILLLTPPDYDNFRRVQRDRELKDVIQRAELPDFPRVQFQRRHAAPDRSLQARRSGRRRGGNSRPIHASRYSRRR